MPRMFSIVLLSTILNEHSFSENLFEFINLYNERNPFLQIEVNQSLHFLVNILLGQKPPKTVLL